MLNLAEHTNYTTVVDARNKCSEQVCQQRWLLLEIERQSLVVTVEQLVRYETKAVNCSAHISTLAARTITSLNWLCSQASDERSIIAKAALSYRTVSRFTAIDMEGDARIRHI